MPQVDETTFKLLLYLANRGRLAEHSAGKLTDHQSSVIRHILATIQMTLDLDDTRLLGEFLADCKAESLDMLK